MAFSIAGRPVWGPLSGLGAGIAVLGFAADRFHKWWMLNVFDIADRGRYQVTSFFDLVMAWNKGVSYGLFQGRNDDWPCRAHSVRAAGRWRARIMVSEGAVEDDCGSHRPRYWRCAGQCSGPLRLWRCGRLFSFHAFGFYWYIFNVADIWIVMGVGLILLNPCFRVCSDRLTPNRVTRVRRARTSVPEAPGKGQRHKAQS